MDSRQPNALPTVATPTDRARPSVATTSTALRRHSAIDGVSMTRPSGIVSVKSSRVSHDARFDVKPTSISSHGSSWCNHE